MCTECAVDVIVWSVEFLDGTEEHACATNASECGYVSESVCVCVLVEGGGVLHLPTAELLTKTFLKRMTILI